MKYRSDNTYNGWTCLQKVNAVFYAKSKLAIKKDLHNWSQKGETRYILLLTKNNAALSIIQEQVRNISIFAFETS